MNNTLLEYQKRVTEVDKYFKLLSILDGGVCIVNCTTIDSQQLTTTVDDDTVRILKANAFVMLYNLVEATVRKSIESIFEVVYDEGLSFKGFSDNFRKLWVNQKTSSLKSLSTGNFDKIKGIILEIADCIITEEITLLTPDCVRINGNIDAQEIRGIAKQFGFTESKDGQHLRTVKDKRNHLAHGEFTFAEIGQNYSFKELSNFKEHTYKYLEDVIANIAIFIKDRQFALAST